jgi:hypothetical protein
MRKKSAQLDQMIMSADTKLEALHQMSEEKEQNIS